MPKSATSASLYPNSSPVISWRSKPARSTAAKKRPTCLSRPTMLWIDDYRPGLELYQAMFEGLGYKVLTAASGEEGIKIAAIASVDIVVTDYEMPGINGEGVARAVKAMNPKIPVILFSGSTLVPSRVRRTVDAVCDKAGSRTHLSTTIQRVLHKKGTSFLQPYPAAQASDVGQRTVA